VVLDPAGETTIRRADQLSKCDFTPFEGLRVPFGLRGVFLRGAEVWAPAGVATQPRGRVVAPEG
jgi:dihydroorotase-like cyclic amidohydrolase